MRSLQPKLHKTSNLNQIGNDRLATCHKCAFRGPTPTRFNFQDPPPNGGTQKSIYFGVLIDRLAVFRRKLRPPARELNGTVQCCFQSSVVLVGTLQPTCIDSPYVVDTTSTVSLINLLLDYYAIRYYRHHRRNYTDRSVEGFS